MFMTCVHKIKSKLDYIHSDLWGPTLVLSYGGNKYLRSLFDDYNRKVWVCMLKNNNKAFMAFIEWKVKVENHSGRKAKMLRMDNELEFYNAKFNEYCRNHEIGRNRTIQGTP